MIIDQDAIKQITAEIVRLQENEHTSRYTSGWIHKYTGETLFNTSVIEGNHNHSYVKTLIPDYKTKLTSKLIHEILLTARTPHPASHGFESGRGEMTYITPHRGKRKLLTVHLESPYDHIGKKRITAISTHLLGLAKEHSEFLALLITKHGKLTFGNPLSPQLLNIQAYKMDRYLSDFSVKYDLTYTRHLDELAFSSNLHIQTSTIAKIKRIISRCKWEINNKLVDIQSGNHFHIASQIMTDSGEINKPKNKDPQKEISTEKKISNLNQMKTPTLNTLMNPSDQTQKELLLMRNLRKLARKSKD